MRGIDEAKESIRDLEAIASEADLLAAAYGKTAQAKRPIIKQGLTLVIRNRDENSPDSWNSVNGIQSAMDIAVAAAGRGLECKIWQANSYLHLLITPIKEQGNE